jgi:hypothetical protein
MKKTEQACGHGWIPRLHRSLHFTFWLITLHYILMTLLTMVKVCCLWANKINAHPLIPSQLSLSTSKPGTAKHNIPSIHCRLPHSTHKLLLLTKAYKGDHHLSKKIFRVPQKKYTAYIQALKRAIIYTLLFLCICIMLYLEHSLTRYDTVHSGSWVPVFPRNIPPSPSW